MKFLGLSHPYVLLPQHLDEELDKLSTLYHLASEEEVASFEVMLRRPHDKSDDESNDDYDDWICVSFFDAIANLHDVFGIFYCRIT